MKPSQDWVNDCLLYHNRILTGEKRHWCPEWDYLPIDETCIEIEYCNCKLKHLEG